MMLISKHQRILNLLALIRDAHPAIKPIFLYGSCLNLFCILRALYPEAEAYSNQNHVLTKIDGKYYDITGRVVPIESDNYKPFTSFHSKRRTSRAFIWMYRK
jgi:hypothetical protein